MTNEYSPDDFEREALRTLRSLNHEADDLAARALITCGTEKVMRLARDAFTLSDQARRERGEIISPVTIFKDLLGRLLNESRSIAVDADERPGPETRSSFSNQTD
jgi:hypothetical protein